MGVLSTECKGTVWDAVRSKTSLSTSCHVAVRSVCSCLRQMTCSAPQGPPVILHPLSPADPADVRHVYVRFLCLVVGFVFIEKCVPLVHKTASSSRPCVRVCTSSEKGAGGWWGCSTLSGEMGSGKCSSGKALHRWIRRRGDTQAPTGETMQSVSVTAGCKSHRHTEALRELLTGPLQRLKAARRGPGAQALWCCLWKAETRNILLPHSRWTFSVRTTHTNHLRGKNGKLTY